MDNRRKLPPNLLPVLDVIQGQIVRAVRGQRDNYQPITSRLAADSRPETVARAFVSHFACGEVYLADLDAIAGRSPQWNVYDAVAACQLRLIVDAGVSSIERARQLREFGQSRRCLSGIVVGLESITDAASLPPFLAVLGPQHALFSLDMKAGRPLTDVARWRDVDPFEIASEAVAAGFRRFIVLDLAAVGAGQGPVTTALCRSLRKVHPQIELISGGGIRSPDDVQELVAAGCDRVLVASALHDGTFGT